MTAAEWGNWFVATPNERLAFSGDEIAALVRDLAACERERDKIKDECLRSLRVLQQATIERDALKARLAEAARFVEYMSICPACGASACEPECSLGKDSPVDYAAMMRARRIRDAWLKEVTDG
jgi:hypothetical protein